MLGRGESLSFINKHRYLSFGETDPESDNSLAIYDGCTKSILYTGRRH